MSDLIKELEERVNGLRASIDRTYPPEWGELREFEAAVTKLVAQKYEAIIEERVADTVKQRLENPLKGDFVIQLAERRREHLTAQMGRLLENEIKGTRGQVRKALVRACDALRWKLEELEYVESQIAKAQGQGE